MAHSILGTDSFNNAITIEQQQRRQGLYIIGSTGRGKTVLLENLIMQEITQGIGLCVLDPHRDLTRRIIELMPVNRLQDVILLDVANNDYAFGLNLYSSPTQSVKDVQYAIERIMHIWERLFNISRLTPQMVQYMRKCAETLIPNPGYTMAEIPRLFDDIPLRNKLLQQVTDPNVLSFWKRHDALSKYNKEQREEQILNKLDEFLTGMVIPIVGQSKSTLDFRTLMDTRPGKIILVQLDPNLDSITSLIGSMIVALVRNAAFSRENMLQNKRKHFSVYADEFDRFATLDFKSIMDECRKYGIAATIAHQTRDVLHRDIPGLVRSTLQGNLVVFQITSPDAEELAGNFDTTPNQEESGRRKKQSPVTDVVHHLLNGGSHPNSVVNQFAFTYSQCLKSSALFVSAGDKRIAQENVQELIRLLFQAMTGSFIDTLAPSARLVEMFTFFKYRQSHPSLYYPASLFYLAQIYNLSIQDALTTIWQFGNGSWPNHPTVFLFETQIKNSMREFRLDTLRNELKYLRNIYREDTNRYSIKNANRTNINRQLINASYATWVAHLQSLNFQYQPSLLEEIDNPQTTTVWYHFDPPALASLVWIDEKTAPNEERKCYNPVVLERVIENRLAEEKADIISFLGELKKVMQALATNPILGDSGEEEIIYKPGSHADKQKEITNMLSGLSVLNAYTRVGGGVQACWNCGDQPFHNDPYCTLCGKKLKPEYHLTITPSSHGLPKRDVDARLAAIVQANVRDGYLRKRSDVLAEIQARQQPPPPPAAPQPAIPPKPPPTPAPAQQAVKPPAQPKAVQSPPPLPQARRKVPKPKICPDCSQPNDPAANFCMKCGKKL